MNASGSCTRRARGLFALTAGIVLALGLLSRVPALQLPSFWGDVLWACMVYALIGLLAPRLSIGRRTLVAWALCMLVECSQCFHAPWLDALRATTWGHLALGSTFVWSDLLCYTLGAACMRVGEGYVRKRGKR